MRISVLMSTYYKDNAAFLDMAFESIWTAQTRKPDEIVLIEDGKLTSALYSTIEKWRKTLNGKLIIVENEKNLGLAKALNAGLAKATGDIIIRMDSDDIAKPERIEKEAYYLEQHPDIDVVGSWIDEFRNTPDDVINTRKVPETTTEILRFGKRRNPMNHPSVAFRRQRIIGHGGYTHFLLFEDYCLWAQLMMKGYRFYNIQESLLWFRTSDDVYARRGGWRYGITEIRFQKYLHNLGYISTTEMLENCAIRFISRITPNCLRKLIYIKLLR